MSSVYATEPATAGRVILETTDGPLEIHLWSRECPDTTRLFLQLCMDGYYDDMIFHRIVNNFMIQTGALRHSSSKATSVSLSSPDAAAYREAIQAPRALERRPYETNSRIRFNHRGQVAMALGTKDSDDVEDLQPQFFVTLEDAEYLNNKHVVFGTIGAGPTIFNALRIGRTETDEATHQPLELDHATRILSVKIVENPLHKDLVPQAKVPWAPQKEHNDDAAKAKKKKKKRKGKFDTNVLSFGSEFDEEESGMATISTATKKKGIQSSHDILDSKILKKEVDETLKDVLMDGESKSTDDNSEIAPKKRQRLDLDHEEGGAEGGPFAKRESEHTFSARKSREDDSSGKTPAMEESEKGQKESAKSSNKSNKPPKVSAVEARRLKYTKGKKTKKEREQETLNKLLAFRSTVQTTVEERKSASSSRKEKSKRAADDSLAARMARKAQKSEDGSSKDNQAVLAPTYNGQVLESEDDENDHEISDNGEKTTKRQKWLGTSFKCRRHMDQEAGKELGGDGRAADDYEVVDFKSKHRRGEKKNKHSRHRSDKNARHH